MGGGCASIPLAYYSFMLPFLNELIGIRCPSGTIYMVKVEMEDGQLMLKEGWNTLARRGAVGADEIRHILEEITELELTPEMRARVRNIWLGSADRFTIYIAKVTERQISSGQMYFSRKFSKLIPDETMDVDMRFRGKDHITVGILKKANCNTYIRGGAWSKFVASHNVKANKIYIFKLSFAKGRATLTVSSALCD
ncbi:hypothetical protein EJB05_30410, partial [Eragrostis curvula]